MTLPVSLRMARYVEQRLWAWQRGTHWQPRQVDDDVVEWWYKAALAYCKAHGHCSVSAARLASVVRTELEPQGVPMMFVRRVGTRRTVPIQQVSPDAIGRVVVHTDTLVVVQQIATCSRLVEAPGEHEKVRWQVGQVVVDGGPVVMLLLLLLWPIPGGF